MLAMSEVAEIANTALFWGEETAHAEPPERAGSIKGKAERTDLIASWQFTLLAQS